MEFIFYHHLGSLPIALFAFNYNFLSSFDVRNFHILPIPGPITATVAHWGADMVHSNKLATPNIENILLLKYCAIPTIPSMNQRVVHSYSIGRHIDNQGWCVMVCTIFSYIYQISMISK